MAWNFGYVTPLEGSGLVVLPYHRIVREGPSLALAAKALEGRFSLSEAADARIVAFAAARSSRPHAFAWSSVPSWPEEARRFISGCG